MYNNLAKALKSKGISINAAAAIGMPEPTFRGKMNVEERSFSVEEAASIKINEMDIFYLFQKEKLPIQDSDSVM